ncbi:MAG: glycoside hydrolase family 2 protein [Candidatus Brockarchaeota archaeon]|nr:glycoside hydrolase family 2 protein [Candidatus Brockarchaeota archaeon]
MISVSLDGEWFFRECEKEEKEPPTLDSGKWLKARVPGVVHLDLQRNGVIPDPFFRMNELEVSWVEDKNWWYGKEFYLDEEFLRHDCIELKFYGIDTFATIWLNNKQVAKTSNMFHEHVFNVKGLLKEGRNILVVRIDSPKRVLEEMYNKDSLKLYGAFYPPVVYGRKAQYSFGWDWGPRLATSGIWRSVVLQAYDVCKIESFYFSSNLSEDLEVAKLNLKLSIEAFKKEHVKVRARISGFSENQVREESKDVSPGSNNFVSDFTIKKPKLWWPNGYGDQNLYDLEITVEGPNGVLDSIRKKVGIRKIEVVQEKDEEGKTFFFKVNNTPVFCKGANWVPADSFLPRVTREVYEYLLDMAKQANMNMIRVWGGGVYEDEAFYELCDEKGIMVWQDFMFACAEYPEEEWFFKLVREEAEKIVKRLRNHPCLAIWCGNNENHVFFKWMWLKTRNKFYGETIYHKMLPETCSKLDPATFYWPGSPYGGDDPNSQSEGDRHNWEVWSMLRDYQEYLNDKGRFISEFGFQSAPSMETIRRFTAPEDRHPQSRVIESHNKQVFGQERLWFFLLAHFKMVSRLEDFVYLTQVNQGDALKTGIEHWRRRKFKTGGALVWQLNDCWPVLSWSLIDYYGNLKASYYYVKRAFDPINFNLVANQSSIEAWVCNDLLKPVRGRIRIVSFNLRSEKLCEKEVETIVEANSSKKCAELTLSELNVKDRFDSFIVGILETDEGESRCDVVFPERLKYLRLPEPRINLSLEKIDEKKYVLKLVSKNVVKACGVSIRGIKAKFNDNFFDLPPGIEKKVSIELEKPLSKSELKRRIIINYYSG